jgi:hypothetical protein
LNTDACWGAWRASRDGCVCAFLQVSATLLGLRLLVPSSRGSPATTDVAVLSVADMRLALGRSAEAVVASLAPHPPRHRCTQPLSLRAHGLRLDVLHGSLLHPLLVPADGGHAFHGESSSVLLPAAATVCLFTADPTTGAGPVQDVTYVETGPLDVVVSSRKYRSLLLALDVGLGDVALASQAFATPPTPSPLETGTASSGSSAPGRGATGGAARDAHGASVGAGASAGAGAGAGAVDSPTPASQPHPPDLHVGPSGTTGRQSEVRVVVASLSITAAMSDGDVERDKVSDPRRPAPGSKWGLFRSEHPLTRPLRQWAGVQLGALCGPTAHPLVLLKAGRVLVRVQRVCLGEVVGARWLA